LFSGQYDNAHEHHKGHERHTPDGVEEIEFPGMEALVQRFERGDEVEERHVLVLDSETELQRLLSPSNLELLKTIRSHEPDSVRAASDLVDRDFKQVHRNLTELDALNVIDLHKEGRSKRPVVRFDEIDIELSLDAGDTDIATA
jgi:predicted transcriptional regulator